MMNQDYLIIYNKDEKTYHEFHETEDSLRIAINWCKKHNFEIYFAAKIAVVKAFIG
jgi:hypothetical protein